MPPKKKARYGSPSNNSKDAEPPQRSDQSNCGVGGHAAQLQKAGESVMAPTRRGKALKNLEIDKFEENPMAPSQSTKAKKKACPSERFGFKLPSATNKHGHSHNKAREEATQRDVRDDGCQDSDHDQLENGAYANHTKYDEDTYRSADDNPTQDQEDEEDSREDEEDPDFRDPSPVNKDDDDDTLMDLD
ncbi:hypothetical protein DFH29DRAFT_1000705 [Suillus ampliporus]|nr:hypothetical protein DFH29DRAFT_1000705 [Suillus ampliporus]